MKKILYIILALSIVVTPLFAQPVAETETKQSTVVFTDSAGRSVEIPSEIEKVAPSGAVATMFLAAFAPEKMSSVSGRISSAQEKYLPSVLANLPETGQMYGSKATLNLETLLYTSPDLVIDLGDYKEGIEKDLDALQEQIGIPVVFIQSDLDHMAGAFRSLGKILSMEERGEELALFIDKTMEMAAKNREKISDDERVSVMYTTGPDGLGTNARGSSQAQVLEIVGAENAIVVEKLSNKGGGNQINLETAILANPDYIVFTDDSIAGSVSSMDGWKEMAAVKNGNFAIVPSLPYNWLGNPPSMNMSIGVWWLGNLLYPQYYDYDMKEKAKEIYSLFWGYELTDEEAESMVR
ncbi:MAG: ABC transporter substrate-binding protein [Candidatus Ornithospirochaeta sp.]